MLQDLQEYIDGNSSLPMHGAYVFPDIDSGLKVASFTADFKVSIHGGTEQAAQGFSFVLAGDIAGFAAPFREGGGTSTGLVISFDTVDNLAGYDAEGNEPGDAPGIIVKIGGQRVAAQKFAGLRTGGPNNQTPNFVPVQIKLEADGTLDVVYNGTKVYDNFPIPYAPIAGNFGVGAGTAELTAAIRANHWFDQMTITTTTVTPGSPVILSALPLGTQVRPDVEVRIEIQDLGSGATALEFDSQGVTASKSTVGGVTTLSYDPPGNLAPGSTHNVKLTYAGKTLLYSFSVLNVTILPASFAAATNTVDTTKSGFKVRVHQTEAAAPGGNSFERAVRQLADAYGPNVADLSAANPDGTFDKDMINMEQEGLEAGSFNATEGHPDEYIPGIPGSIGNTDNIAMEITGYLDLKKGVYSFGLVSDDNARFTIGPDLRDATALNLIDITIGTAANTILVDQDGLYPLRVVWAEGTGGAHLELYSIDASGTRTLLNDRATAGHVKVYRQLKTGVQPAPYLSSAKPAPSEANVSITPKIELQITEENTTVNPGSIRLWLNDALVALAADAISKTGKVTTIKHTVTALLAAKTEQRLKLEFSDSAGRNVVRQYAFTTGAGRGVSFANSVKGYWTFDKGNLRAAVGRDLKYIDDALANRYQFGTTTQFGIPGIGGKEARVLHIPYSANDEGRAVFSKIGLRMQPNITPNGGGRKINQYTLIMDLFWGEEGPSGFGSILQTHDFDNPTDGDMFWRASDGSYGKGCCSSYDGISQEPGHNHKRGEWARVVFAVDITQKRVAKYVNGFKHREDVQGDGANVDGRFALPGEVFLFGDGDDNERTDCYVNAIQLREGALTDDEVAALDGPVADGIPLFYSQWDFDKGNLAATVGSDLAYIDDALANRFQFGTTTQLGVPGIGGKEARVIYIPYSSNDEGRAVFSKIGLRLPHGLGANGGGQKLNQYTLIMDMLWGENGPSGFGSILQTHDFSNPTDGDMFWRASDGSYGKGCCSSYDGISQEPGHNHKRGEWARVVFAVDITQKRVAKYVNGFKHREDVQGDGANVDGRFALPGEVFVFGDGDDNERTDCYVNSIQIRAGAMTDEEVANLGGASGDGIPTPNPVKGEWNFDAGTLAATIGQDLLYIDAALANRYQFGASAQLGIPGIDGKDVAVIHIPYSPSDEGRAVFSKIGLRVNHGVPPNGGGQKANQYTIIMDVLWGEDGPSGFGSILQTHDFDNPTDGDMFWRASDGSYGKGCCSNYDGISQEPGHNHKRGEWARVVFAVDITQKRVAKFVNGFKHREDVQGDGANVDGRFALPPQVFMFGDGDDNERTDCYVNAIQIREGAMTDDEVVALGGPSPFGIPAAPGAGGLLVPPVKPAISIAISGVNIVLTYKGVLQSADNVQGPYTDVAGAASPFSVQPTGARKFYRTRQ
jgi:3-hydroxy-3-methylglutaryl CoA synthase